MRKAIICIFSLICFTLLSVTAQDHTSQNHNNHKEEAHAAHGHDDHSHEEGHGHGHDNHGHDAHGDAGHGHEAHAGHDDHAGGHGHCSCGVQEHKYDAAEVAFHHIMDANQFHVFGDIYVPLPCLLKSDDGFKFTMSSSFGNAGHGNGKYAIDRYVMNHGTVMRVAANDFPMGKVEVSCFGHETIEKDGKELPLHTVEYQGKCWELHEKSTLDGGMLGGGMTSFYDFSITKNVLTLILVFFILYFVFTKAAKAYAKRGEGKAPTGLQNAVETIVVFLRDEMAVPFLGKEKANKHLPFLLSVFFFILGLNLIGQIPFFPGSGNVSGSLSVTAVLAIFAFFVVNLSGNKHYWEHVLWMPGVPPAVKLILTPVEIMGLFIKPFTLMLRLFANITAGHIVMVIFVSLIFIFGGAPTLDQSGNLLGSSIGTFLAIPLTMFMMALELLVAFIQAFVFTILTTAYLSAAVEEAHH